MGLGFSQDGQEERLFEFRKLSTEQLEFEIPERPENRRPTDRPWIFLFVIVLVLLVPFLIYTLMYTELGQLSGSDDCGNFCGYKNKKYYLWPCTGKDYTNKTYMHIIDTIAIEDHYEYSTECVSSCPNDTLKIFHTCLPSSDPSGNVYINSSFEEFVAQLADIGKDIARGWWIIVLSAMISCVLSVGALSLFKYAADYVVWIIMFSSIVLFGIASGFCWYGFLHYNDQGGNYNRKVQSKLLFLAVFSSILVMLFVFMVTCMVKRIKLIIALFKEASKAIFDIPSLVLVPVYTSIVMTLALLIFAVLTFFMTLAGQLTEIARDYMIYRQDGVMIATIVYNSFTFIWFTFFVFGSQYIVLAGAVSAWFFSSNKHQLNAPIKTSFLNYIHFHLGTVAFGSLILTLITIVRGIIRKMNDNPRTRWLVDCFLRHIEELVRFLSNNAYIQTAMHGQPFFKSGKRAAKLLVANAVNVIAVNSIGDYILAIAQLLLITVCSCAGILIAMSSGYEHYWCIAVVCSIVSVFIAAIFFSLFQATIDCIFICFCEDKSLNDGMARPYFMSKDLMKFIEDSKAIMIKE